MYLNGTYELTCVIDSDKFCKLFDRVYSELEYVDENKYADYTLASKGITVLYRDSQYKKKIKLHVNPCQLLDSDKPDPEKLVRKLEKRVSSYFNHKYQLDDFDLTGLALVTDIDVHSRANVDSYIKVLSRIGKVKGFSPSRDDWPGAGIYLIFLDTFMRVVPFGNFYKKDKAEEIVRAKVDDLIIRRRMLRLLELVPEKKSLLLAQKALNYRRVDEVMAEFSSIEVAPVTISKRHDIKKLDNLYKYM